MTSTVLSVLSPLAGTVNVIAALTSISIIAIDSQIAYHSLFLNFAVLHYKSATVVGFWLVSLRISYPSLAPNLKYVS